MIRVLVADDSASFRFGMRMLLQAVEDLEIVGEAATGDEAVAQSAHTRPDVVVMDLHMAGDRDGITATARIVEQSPHVGVLVLTMAAEEATLVRALRSGARGYLVKGSPRDEIERAVRTVADGGLVVGASLAGRAGALLSGAPREDGLSHLSAREREVLGLMAEGLDNGAIAGRLGLSPKTVRNVVSSVFTKLPAADRVQAVLRAKELGIRGTDP